MSQFETRGLKELFQCDTLESLERYIAYKVFSTSKAWGGVIRVRGAEVMLKAAVFTRWFILDPQNIPEGARHHISTEIAMLWEIRRRIIERNYSPAFMEILHSQVCKIPENKRVIPDRDPPGDTAQKDAADSLNSIIRHGRSSDSQDVALIFLEKCDMTFKKFVPRLIFAHDMEIFKSIAFVLVHGWHVLHLVIPDFRHGDTHADNFMVKLEPTAGFTCNPPVIILYALGKTFAVPYYGVLPKVIDFDHARSEALGVITYTANMRMVNMYSNELARLFSELARQIPKIRGCTEFSKAATQFMHQIYSWNAYLEDADELNQKFPTTEEILRMDVFKGYVLADRILEGDELLGAVPKGVTVKHIYRRVPDS